MTRPFYFLLMRGSEVGGSGNTKKENVEDEDEEDAPGFLIAWGLDGDTFVSLSKSEVKGQLEKFETLRHVLAVEEKVEKFEAALRNGGQNYVDQLYLARR